MNFSFFFPVVSGIAIIIIALNFAIAIYINLRTPKSDNSDYLKKRLVSEEISKNETFIIKELINGEIKCHTIKNSAQPYNAKEWVIKMEEFTNKTIYAQLLNMEGHNGNEEY